MVSPDDKASSSPRLLAPGVALLIGVILVGLALPRITAYFDVVSWRDFSQAGPQPGDTLEETDAQLAAYRAAVGWLPGDAGLQQFRGRLALLALRPRRTENAVLKEEAASALRSAVAAAPNRACAWAMYAYAGSRYALSSVSVEPAVSLAYILSPPSPACAGLRVAAILSLPGAIPDDLKPYVEADLRSLWSSQARGDLAYIYRDAPAGRQDFIVSGISGGKGDRAWMEGFVREVLEADARRAQQGGAP